MQVGEEWVYLTNNPALFITERCQGGKAEQAR